VSLPGLGLTGHDAAFACNHTEVGLKVEETIDYSDSAWEAIILTRVIDSEVASESDLDIVAEKAFAAGKKVVWFDNCSAEIPKVVLQLVSENPYQIRTYTPDSSLPVNNRIDDRYCNPDVPIVMVGGLLTEADVFEALLGITVQVKADGLRPLVFARHPVGGLFGLHSVMHICSTLELTEAQKISKINLLVRDYEGFERPDVIIIEAPDSLMRFSDVAPNGFGIQSYMVTQAIRPDLCVCCIPCDLTDTTFLSNLSCDFSIRLGTAINAVHASNIIVDSAELLQTKEISCAHASIEEVRRTVERIQPSAPIPVFDVVTDSASSMYSEIRQLIKT